MEEKKIFSLLEDLKDDAHSYVSNSIKLAKYEAFDKISNGTAIISVFLAIITVFLFALFLIFFSLGYYLGDLFNNICIGFAIDAGIMFLFAIIIILLRKPIRKGITNAVITFLMRNEED